MYRALTFISILFSCSTQAGITINGTVTDRDGNPVTKCDVFFNEQKWITKDSVHATCNDKGEYQAEIDPGLYNSIYICDEEKYAKTALEFWGWNLNLQESQTIDAAFDTIEVYSLTTWASNGGSLTQFASFRPMRLQNSSATQKMTLVEANFYNKEVQGKNIAVLDVAPSMTAESIVATVDDQPLELLDYFWTYEKIDTCSMFPENIDTQQGCYMPMIIAQFKKLKMDAKQHTLKVRVIDSENGEIGEGITHFTPNESGYGF